MRHTPLVKEKTWVDSDYIKGTGEINSALAYRIGKQGTWVRCKVQYAVLGMYQRKRQT